MVAFIEIDGAQGEGGGQVLRSSLSLSMLTGKPVRLRNIRAKRKKPGLLRQHLTAVRAATVIGAARAEGDELRSSELSFEPGTVLPGRHHFAVGTAGSSTLVLQTVLWPLLLADAPSEITVEGGTHNRMAPPFDFLERTFRPAVARMGARFELRLVRAGFYPAGGGCLVAEIPGSAELGPLELCEREAQLDQRARAVAANLPRSVMRRELAAVRDRLGWSHGCLLEEPVASPGPGNVLFLEVDHGTHTTVVSSFGERGLRAERVASKAVDELEAFLAHDAPVDAHLADQLLIPMALAGSGNFRTCEPTLHARTNAEIIEKFLPVKFVFEAESSGSTWRVRVGS